MSNLTELAPVLQCLAEIENPVILRHALDAALNFPYHIHYAKDFCELNPLIDAIRADKALYARVKLLVDTRRLDENKRLMFPAEEKKFDRVTSQRDLMRERRARSKRALIIENAQRPAQEKLRGNSRLEFERKVLADWGRKLQALIDISREHFGGKVPKEELARVRNRFWKQVDDQLSEQEAQLQREGKLAPR